MLQNEEAIVRQGQNTVIPSAQMFHRLTSHCKLRKQITKRKLVQGRTICNKYVWHSRSLNGTVRLSSSFSSTGLGNNSAARIIHIDDGASLSEEISILLQESQNRFLINRAVLSGLLHNLIALDGAKNYRSHKTISWIGAITLLGKFATKRKPSSMIFFGF